MSGRVKKQRVKKLELSSSSSSEEESDVESLKSNDGECFVSEDDDGNSVSEPEEVEEGGRFHHKHSSVDPHLVASGGIFMDLVLKDDHEERPLWVTPKCVIYLERTSKFYFHAYEFLSTVGEPVSRSELVHEWVLTKNSLHAASSVEMTPKGIIDELEKLSKVRVPEPVKLFIQECADSYGKVKIVLREGDLFVESSRPDLLFRLLDESPEIRSARLPMRPKAEQQNESIEATIQEATSGAGDPIPELTTKDRKLLNTDEPTVRQFRIDVAKVEQVKKSALALNMPLMEEFDYLSDHSTPRVKANLKHTAEIRPYQQKCLSKMFGNSRAKSGVFVLPCGAGKTLTGIAAVCTMQRSALVLCSGTVAVEQWRRQFMQFADVENLVRYTSKVKDDLDQFLAKNNDSSQPIPGCVLVTTYSMMLSKAGKNKARKTESEAQEQLNALLDREWGLLILDEVHVTPANAFRRIINRVKAHCKLGLTATLVREDDLIQDLSFLIGPKLYEANWMDLTAQGYLARVNCVETRCPMTEEFMAEYLRTDDNAELRRLLVALNPNKFRACEYLMRYHEDRGDKILIFCDSILALEYYAKVLNRDYIHGQTPDATRLKLFASFQASPVVNTLLVSKVGDIAIDLPEATVIIQVSGHFGSRRQEAQRLGRILRPKPNSNPREFNAHFYSLVSPDTEEQYFANRRQRYLVDQGYAFKVTDNILQIAESAGLRTSNTLASLHDQRVLLARLLMSQDKGKKESTKEASEVIGYSQTSLATQQPTRDVLPAVKRVERATLAAMSTAAGSTTYTEFQRKPGV